MGRRTLLGGRYRLVEKLGIGGMSEVWRGYDETLGRSVAVKVLSLRLADDQVFRDRLRQEALSAARLCHPHITGVFDFGETPLNDRVTVPYVVMELNDGESVSARIARRGRLPWHEAVTVAAEVASALATAHARGVVHRDVTPANVMLTGSGAKVVDFGISAVVGQRDAAPDGSLLGTPAYLAPERLGGSQVSAATDVYALGLLLYRSLTGHLPWPADTTAEALRAHLYADPVPLPEIAGLPSAVRDLCLTCLSKSPADRPGAAEVARVLSAEVGMQPIIPPLSARDVPAVGRSPVSNVDLPSGLLAYFGFSRLSLERLRLRAGLRFGAALRLGGVRPLGGGVFVPARTGLPAGLIVVALLAAAGLSWAVGRESPEVHQAQAAGAAPVAVAPTACKVRYQLRRDSGRSYEALLTVATAAEAPDATWRVQFSYPGSQRLTGTPKAVTQKGRKVVARGSGKLQSFTLRGAYRGYNSLPLAFTLDGHRCRAEVLGGVTRIDTEAAAPRAASTSD
ncbi:protein kinase [Actinoplanes sp. TBRC 11911]|uniref:serine/threonine-protein kinase n=1 Tax=Actinoplanes sp. TBRC 11911 TaxID=2729386 RepID=UPI00145E7ECE|nr:serine/threonine-protein kinase [Actinoplanes sp. TBRC 11911]NMO54918.1 protein kinase [Actinoplanes sp. TBRC 11911]